MKKPLTNDSIGKLQTWLSDAAETRPSVAWSFLEYKDSGNMEFAKDGFGPGWLVQGHAASNVTNMSTPTASLSQSTSREQEQSAKETEMYLIHLSTRLIDLLNSRDYANDYFINHVSRKVYIEFQGKCTTGLEPFIENYKIDADRSPAFYVNISNSSALVDEDAGTATVILSQHLRGYEDEMRGKGKAGTILLSWRRGKGRWWIGSGYMMFGTPEFLL